MRLHLVEPKAHGLISGGYRYNHSLAEACPRVHLVELDARRLEQQLARLAVRTGEWLILDSLFFEPESFETFLATKRITGCKLALVLHAFPSIVSRAASLMPERVAKLGPTTSETRLLTKLDAVICPGPHAIRQLQASGVQPRTLLCPPGAPEVPAGQPPSEPSRTRVLSVGNVTRAKGYMDALTAIRDLAENRLVWEIIGSLEADPGFVVELKQKTLEWRLETQVSYVGQLPHAETLRRYAQSDVFLLASYTENYPLVLLEAQAHALPVVAYSVHGVPDIVSHERDGLLAAAGDSSALTEHLRRFVHSAALRRSHGLAAREAARRRPKWDDVCATLAELEQT